MKCLKSVAGLNRRMTQPEEQLKNSRANQQQLSNMKNREKAEQNLQALQDGFRTSNLCLIEVAREERQMVWKHIAERHKFTDLRSSANIREDKYV